LQHWQAIAIAACEQSGRNRLPVIASPLTLPAWFAQIKNIKGFVLSPHVQTKLTDININTPMALLIGPEGGLSEQEMTLAIQHQFTPLNLGPRVLRTETATIAALSVLQYAFGDFSY